MVIMSQISIDTVANSIKLMILSWPLVGVKNENENHRERCPSGYFAAGASGSQDILVNGNESCDFAVGARGSKDIVLKGIEAVISLRKLAGVRRSP